jgi:hypothetical protein
VSALSPGVYTVAISITSVFTFRVNAPMFSSFQTTTLCLAAWILRCSCPGDVQEKNIIEWPVVIAIGAGAYEGHYLAETDVVFVTGSILDGDIV